MKIEVLVSTMERENADIYDAMGLSTDAVIINQHNRQDKVNINKNGNDVLFCTYNERGIGRSRNNAIKNSRGDICIFADDDMLFYDGYADIVKAEFEENRNADAILFNIDVENADRPVEKISKSRRMTVRDAMRYGIPALAVKREVLFKHNMSFSLLFGGGAKYGSGEDTIFFKEMLDKNIKVYISDKKIAQTDAGESTWFKGFDDKFFSDKGALYAAMFGKKAKLTAIVTSYRWQKKLGGEYKFKKILRLMYKGIDEFLA